MNNDKSVSEMAQPDFDVRIRSARTLLLEVWNDLKTCALFQDRMTGIPMHFAELDKALCGLRKGELIVLAGRPGIGKSIFVQSLIRNVCRKEDAHVALFSLESTAEAVMRGIVAGLAGIDANRIRDGNIGLDEMEKLSRASSVAEEFNLWIDDTPSLSLPDLRGKAFHLRHKHDIGLIVIDYLQLMSIPDSASWNREQDIAEIIRKVKELAKILKLPVILVSQLSREPETRHDNRPVLSDLCDSGAIEQDADVVLLLHRHEYYREDEHPGEAEMIVAKHRNGPAGHVRLAFIGSQHRFENLAAYVPSTDDER
jgi:replicative DNA helicase